MVIDIEKIKNLLECDDEFVLLIIDKFLEEGSYTMEKINEAKHTEDWQEVKYGAHKMLSSSRILQLDDMSNILEKLEDTAREVVNKEEIFLLVGQLNQLWEKYSMEINAFRIEIK